MFSSVSLAVRSALRRVVVISSVLGAGVLGTVLPSASAIAQKPGGILRITHRDSPASMSIHEEGTISVVLPMMGVFNTSSCSTSTSGRTASTASYPTWPRSGRGARTARRSTFALAQRRHMA